jgi:hypothetical protein
MCKPMFDTIKLTMNVYMPKRGNLVTNAEIANGEGLNSTFDFTQPFGVLFRSTKQN